MRLHTAPLIALSVALLTVPLTSPAQDTDEMMKQLQDQGMNQEDLQKMLEQLGGMMPKMVPPGSYTNEQQQYRLTIPEGWTGSQVGDVLIAVNGEAVESVFGPESEAFTVFVQPADEIRSEFEGKSLEQIDLDDYRELVKRELKEQENVSDLEIITMEKMEFKGNTAVHVLQKFHGENTDMGYAGVMMAEMFVVEHGDNYFNIVYMSPEVNWDKYKDFVKQHLDKIELL